MNQRVHLFWRGCLTLKLSLSWKTVTGLSSDLLSAFSPLGFSTGMVVRSTCLSMLFDSAAAAAMMTTDRANCDYLRFVVMGEGFVEVERESRWAGSRKRSGRRGGRYRSTVPLLGREG